MKEGREKAPLPIRATGIFLGLWMAVLLTLAFVIVPAVFSTCYPTGNPVPSASP